MTLYVGTPGGLFKISRRAHARTAAHSSNPVARRLQWSVVPIALFEKLRVAAGAAGRGRWRVLLVLCAGMIGCEPPSRTPVGAAATPVPGARDAGATSGAPAALTGASQAVTWTCSASPCPWGASLTNHALVWPADAGAARTRLGYTVSAGVYLAAAQGNGATLAIETGAARVYAGPPGAADHRLLATVPAGQAFHVTGLFVGEVLSVQGDGPFRYRLTLSPEPLREAPPPPAAATAGPPGGAPGPAPPAKPQRHPPGTPRGTVVQAVAAQWRCNHTPGCFSDPWPGSVIPWPAWSAHQSNGRSGNVLRFVFSTRGAALYPYMGAWAQGCEVTAESGTVKVVEWKRGSESWRQTVLAPGEFHVIDLVPPEDGALIEAGIEGASAFSVSLRNCTPQRIDAR